MVLKEQRNEGTEKRQSDHRAVIKRVLLPPQEEGIIIIISNMIAPLSSAETKGPTQEGGR